MHRFFARRDDLASLSARNLNAVNSQPASLVNSSGEIIERAVLGFREKVKQEESHYMAGRRWKTSEICWRPHVYALLWDFHIHIHMLPRNMRVRMEGRRASISSLYCDFTRETTSKVVSRPWGVSKMYLTGQLVFAPLELYVLLKYISAEAKLSCEKSVS